MDQKRSSTWDDVASLIPVAGGSISGVINPPDGMSIRQGGDALGTYGSTGGITAPIGLLLSKGGIPFSKQHIKNFLLKAVAASSIGTFVGTRLGRINESKSYKKANTDINQELKSPGFLAQLASEYVTDPPVQTVKDIGSSVTHAASGDSQAGVGKLLSGFGNALMTGATFVPGLGLAGKGVRLLGKGTALGAKAMNLTNAAQKINRGSAVASKYLRAPVTFLKKTPVLNVLTGNKNLMKYTPKPTGQSFLSGQNLLRLGKNSGKFIGNSAPGIGATALGLGGGELMYSSSPSGQMDSMLNSSIFSDVIGKDLVNEISGLSQKDKLRVYDYLKNKTDIPQKVLGDWTT